MGMFDEIKCEAPLPETPIPPPGDVFQTKDTPDQRMTRYTITADGKLTWRPYHMETVPKEDRKYPDEDGIFGLIGSIRRVEQDPVAIAYHGDICFYAAGGRYGDGGWWEYRARFTDGQLIDITLEEYLPTDQD